VVRLAVTTKIHAQKPPEGVYPVKLGYENTVHVEQYMTELEYICRQLWTYLGYAGLGIFWADDPSNEAILKKNQDKLENFFYYMDKIDVDWRSYLALVLPLRDYPSWQRLLLLVNSRNHWYWTADLRARAGSSEALDELADFVYRFIEKQINLYGSARVKTSSRIQVKDGKKKSSSFRTKYYAVYTLLVDRFKQLHEQGVDPMIWLDVKFDAASKLDFVYLSTIANYNGFDPDLANLTAVVNDDWREIRSFLGLSRSCKFPDGSIPVGWLPHKDDPNDIWDIARVTKDGFYYYSNGEQRRGKYHYMKNRYHLIACTPSNFHMFKDSWRDVRRLTDRPTWAEYSQFAVYPDMWNEKGEAVNGRMPNVRWRKQ